MGRKGEPRSADTKMKLSLSLKGRFRDKFFSAETRKKISEKVNGENHPSFKENPCLSSIHRYVRRRNPPPENCTVCGKTAKLDLANINGVYNREFCSYRYMCRKCHQLSDGRLNNLFYNKLKEKTKEKVNA